MQIDFPLKGTGKIIYDPARPGMKRRTQWWCIATINRDITAYYRWFVERRYHVNLIQPAWDAHISIIRGERPQPDKMHLWRKYHGQIVEFTYTPYIRQSGDTTFDRPNDFLFLEVDCPFFKNMRDEFGFKSDWKQHITIGKPKYDQGLFCKFEDI